MTLKKSDLHKEIESRIDLAALPEGARNGFLITQGNIARNEDSSVRIRKLERANGDIEYTMTGKFRPNGDEAETEISPEMFESLFSIAFSKQRKMRFKIEGWDVDQFSDGRIVAEYEFGPGETTVKIPDGWVISEKVASIVKSSFWIKKN